MLNFVTQSGESSWLKQQNAAAEATAAGSTAESGTGEAAVPSSLTSRLLKHLGSPGIVELMQRLLELGEEDDASSLDESQVAAKFRAFSHASFDAYQTASAAAQTPPSKGSAAAKLVSWLQSNQIVEKALAFLDAKSDIKVASVFTSDPE
jgi:hypothetical protein